MRREVAGDDSEFLHHAPCPCGQSSDGAGVYSDGHVFCFVCSKHFKGDGSPLEPAKTGVRVAGLIPAGEHAALSKRKLTVESCRRFNYTTTTYSGKPVQVANYHDPKTGEVVAQKVRFPNKDFTFLGEPKRVGLYGQHLWRDGGKRIFITEGEIDAISASQALSHKWPVVSVPNGSGGAHKDIAKQLEWLNKFETVVLCFDNDDPGREATAKCAGLFPPGKVAIWHPPLKDASDMLQAGRQADLVQCMWEAKAYRPDGIVTIKDMRERVLTAPTWGDPWFLPELTKLTYGRRLGECVGLGAGTGVGKSDFIAQQIAYDLTELKLPVGAFMLEQPPEETIKRIAGKSAAQRFHIPDAGWTQEGLVEALDKIENNGRLFLYDNFGATDWDVIRERIRFLHHAEGVNHFYLDHLTALAAAEEDERVALERIMAEVSSTCKELRVWLLFVSHLATPEGKPHEEGGRVMIRHFKGSRAIGFWSHGMFGLERDQQAEDAVAQQQTTFRILKDRLGGQATGKTINLGYEVATGLIGEREADSDFAPINEGEQQDF